MAYLLAEFQSLRLQAEAQMAQVEGLVPSAPPGMREAFQSALGMYRFQLTRLHDPKLYQLLTLNEDEVFLSPANVNTLHEKRQEWVNFFQGLIQQMEMAKQTIISAEIVEWQGQLFGFAPPRPPSGY